MHQSLFVIAAWGLCAATLSSCTRSEPATPSNAALTRALDTLQEEHPAVPGFAMAVIDRDGLSSAAIGTADPAGTAMTPDTPVRVASITKTFVAATVLRYWEEGAIDLDAPIAGLIDAAMDGPLKSDGYDTDVITVRHLLMHAGGMADHAGEGYLQEVLADPARVWTPLEQVAVLIRDTDPFGAPGEAFSYSDTGYVVLGSILTRLAGLPLHEVVRKEMRFDELGLTALYWDEVETPWQGVPARAHQYYEGFDIRALHGSMDGHGGGGIVASVEDVARFFDALFGGEIFRSPQTLALMTTAPGHPEGSPYRLGLFTYELSGEQAFGHGGFWGTFVSHVPSKDFTVSGAALDEAGYRPMREVMAGLAAE